MVFNEGFDLNSSNALDLQSPDRKPLPSDTPKPHHDAASVEQRGIPSKSTDENSNALLLLLPPELICRIIEFLEYGDVLRVVCVCRALKEVVDTNQTWRFFLQRRCRTATPGVIVSPQLELCSSAERSRVFASAKAMGSKRIFRHLFGPRRWPREFNDEVLAKLGLIGNADGSVQKVTGDCDPVREDVSEHHRDVSGVPELRHGSARGGGRIGEASDVRLLGNGVFLFRAGPIHSGAPWICPHCHTFVPLQNTTHRGSPFTHRVIGISNVQLVRTAAPDGRFGAGGAAHGEPPPQCPECGKAAPPLVQSLTDGTCIVGLGSSVVIVRTECSVLLT